MSDREVFLRVEGIELSTHRDGSATIIVPAHAGERGAQHLQLDASEVDALYMAMAAAAIATGRSAHVAG